MVYDAVVVGGSFAGLSGALMLARARKSVAVVDGGLPRNRFAAHAHGTLALDGVPGSEILAKGREQLLRYPAVALIHGQAIDAAGSIEEFRVSLEDGRALEGRRLLLATGLRDSLPDIPGLSERWGATVLHCPYCHGYEIGGGPIGVLATSPISAHQALVAADWGEVTLFLNGAHEPDEAMKASLDRRGVAVERGHVAGIEGEGAGMEGVRLADGRNVRSRALFVAPVVTMASPIAERLGCAFEDTLVGRLIRTDAAKLTSVAGVHAAGDAALPRHSVTLACADGALAGVGLHHALIAQEAAA